jgi:uncharacterized protein YebE (UPF0316 family)
LARKVPWYVIADWKSIAWVIGVLLILVGLGIFVRLPEIIRNHRTSNYEGTTVGVIRELKENTRLKQGLDGTDFVIESYSVDYYFQLNGVTYNRTDIIPATADNYNRLKKILTGNNNRAVKIKYDLKNPTRSLLILN